MASTPAVGPRPTARTKSSAQTISGTLRRKISRPRTGQRRAWAHQAGRPPRCRADSDSARLAQREAGRAITSARLMPAVAMARVSRVARPNSWRNSSPCSGGQKPERNWPMVWTLPGSSSTAGFSSLSSRPGQSNARASRVSSSRGRAAGSRGAEFSIVECAAREPGWAASWAYCRAIVRWRRGRRGRPG
ncbi:hypothetical protein D3C76_1283990 [compost metagenome]